MPCMLQYIYPINFWEEIKMKKRIIAAASAIILSLGSISAFATAEKITIDGNTVDIPADMGIIREVNDRTFVPLRFVSQYLGCQVNYNETEYTTETEYGKTTTVTRNVTFTDMSTNTSYYFTIGDDKIFVLDGTEAKLAPLGEATFLGDDDRTYIPVRAFGELLGYTVDWDEVNQTVSLEKSEK